MKTDMTVPPSVLQLLRMWLLGNLLMVGGLLGIWLGVIGSLETTLAILCAAVVSLSTVFVVLSVARRTPRVVVTSEGFAFHHLFGGRYYKWVEIEGQFGVIKSGLNKLVGINLTTDYKARVGKSPRPCSPLR